MKKRVTLQSLRQVAIGEWLFKTSRMGEIICVVAYSPIFNYSRVQFFRNEAAASNFIDYLLLQTSMIKDDKGAS